MAYRIQLRRDTAANWTAANPTLAQGEVGYELDTGKLKIGNGVQNWNSLSYFDDRETDFAGYATTDYVDGEISALSIPSKVSDLSNDTGFLTVSDLVGYATEDYVDQAVSSITIPADISDLTDTQGLLGQGSGSANTGDITFTNSTISAGSNDEVVVQAIDADSFATARLNLEPEYSTAKLSAFSSESVQTFTSANGDFATGVWQDNGFGNGVVSFTEAQNIGDFFQNTLTNLTPDNVTITINSEPSFVWNAGTSGSGTSTPGFGTNPIVPASPITITSISFSYRQESYISVNYDNQEIRLDAQNAGIRIDATSGIQMYGDSEIDLQAETYLRLSAGENIDIGTGSSYSVNISTGDFSVSAFDDINIRGNDSFRLRNESPTSPIRIITDDDNEEHTWAFNADGTLTFPDATVQTTAYTGEGAGGTATGIVNTTAAEVRIGANGYEVEFIGSISNGFGDASGATILVTEIISGTITDGMTIYGNGLPEEGWVLTFTSSLEPIGSGGTGNYVLEGANYLIPSQSFNNGVLVDTSVWKFRTDSILEFPEAVINVENPETGQYPAIHFPVPESTGGYIGVTPNGLGIGVDVNAWQFEFDGRIRLPNNGFIAEGVVTDNPTIELTPADPAVESQKLVIKGGGPIEEYHLHLTTGDLTETSIFLGTDEHNVRTNIEGGIEITSRNYSVGESNTWTFNANGDLTFPNGEVQATGYAGGNGHMMFIDTNRTGEYTANGSADKPFQTFAAAIEAVAELNPTGTVPYTFVLMGCNINETVDFTNYNFNFITISTTCRSTFNNPVTFGNSALKQLLIRGVEFGNTFTITGDGTADQMNNVSIYNASFSGAVNITATNATAFYEAAFFSAVNFTNLSYLYINGAQFNADWTITADSNGVIPSRGINPGTGGSIAVIFGTIANNVIFVKGGTASYVFQPHMTRLGRTDQSYTIPAGWTVSSYSSVFRGTWTNSGSLGLRNSSTDNRVLGTAAAVSGIIGGDRVIAKLAPATSKGVAGDRQGMIAADSTYYYVCTADYTDGVADIWSRNPLASGTW